MYKWELQKVQKLPNYPLSVYLGTLGMPGMTAYQALKAYAVDKLKKASLQLRTKHTEYTSGSCAFAVEDNVRVRWRGAGGDFRH